MTRLTIMVGLLVLSVAGSHGRPLQDTSSWAEVSPGDEMFRVSMPRAPEQQSQTYTYGELRVSGKMYDTIAGGATYTIWSFINNRPVFASDPDRYLDACADLVWESLLKPARDKLPKDGRVVARMTYMNELPAKPLPGREYFVRVGEITGTTRFYVARESVYVLMVLNNPGDVWATERFFQSFSVKPGIATLDSDPVLIGPGIRGKADDNAEVFGSREITQRVRILAKPEPNYTESARKYGVQGTVVLSAVLSKEGQVEKIHVVRKLPHGLTEAALTAARGIKFEPAQKDGQAVSQYLQLQYNFNLF